MKKAGAIKEIFYPEWLANTVVVKKKVGKWRVCMDLLISIKPAPMIVFLFKRLTSL